MAKFIQPQQLAQVQGSMGNQAIVQNNEPNVAQATNNLLQIADVAGDMYAKSKAQSFVTESIEDLDAARAVAEEGRFTTGDQVPEELKVDQKEWDMIAGAVQSGNMSRENARLITSSRLRSRIAQQPLFADRMRQGASAILGFNIQSEGAQQYFNSFATASSLAQERAGGVDKERAKLMNEAARLQEVGIFGSVDEGYRMLVKQSHVANRKKMASDQLELGGITAQQFATQFIAADQSSSWGETLGEIRAFETQQGKPIDGVAFSRILDERRVATVEEFNIGWQKDGAVTGTPEYNRALGNLTKEYTDMKEFAMAYGVDNLTKIELERNVQAREMYGDTFYPTMKFITETFGQQVASDVIKMSSLTDSQREYRFRNNPQLRNAFELMGSDPDTFNRTLGTVGARLVQGEDLSDVDPVIVDEAAKTLFNEGEPETQKTVIEALSGKNLIIKSLSLMANRSPRTQHADNIAKFKENYSNSLEPAIKQFTQQITANPNLTWKLNNEGMLSVEVVNTAPDINAVGAGGLMPDPVEAQSRLFQAKRAKQTADKINQFAIGHKNGWSTVVGENLEGYSDRVQKLVGSNMVDTANDRNNVVNSRLDLIVGLIQDNDVEAAERQYLDLQSSYPFVARESWSDVISGTAGGE